MSQRPHTFVVRKDDEWEAITSAPRLDMVFGLLTAGPCSMRELSELLDRPADGLYHHLRILESAGLVTVVEERSVGARTERVYDLVAPTITVDPSIERQPVRERVSRLFRTMMQHAQREILRSLEGDRAVLRSEGKTVTLKWATSWLDEDRLARVHEHQAAITEIMLEGMRERTGELFSILNYLTPVTRSRGAGSSSSESKGES